LPKDRITVPDYRNTIITSSPAASSTSPHSKSIITKPFTGDFNQMVSRRLIRVGVTRNRTFYFVDKGVQRQPEKGASRSSTALS